MDGSRLVLHKVCLFEFRRSFVLKRIWMCDRCFVVAFGGKPMCHHYSFQGHRVVNKLVMLGTRTYHKTCDELRTYNWQLVAICEFMNLWKIGSHPPLPASDLTNGIAPTHTHFCSDSSFPFRWYSMCDKVCSLIECVSKREHGKQTLWNSKYKNNITWHSVHVSIGLA